MGIKERLLEIADSTDRYNFHSHTQFCDGRASMEEMAEGALRAGLLHYGFTPHSPIPIESSCNMHPDSVKLFLAEASRLKKIYKGTMEIYTGMEIDYLGDEWGASTDYFLNLPLDYRISSVHFIRNQVGEYVDVDGRPENFIRKMSEFFDSDIRYVVEQFYSRTIDMIEKGGFDIIGHFDKIGLNASKYKPGIEDEEWYVKLVEKTIDAIAGSGLIAEINTKHYSVHGRMFPDERYIDKLKRAGVPMIVNSDAHYPDLTDASRKEGLALLKKDYS